MARYLGLWRSVTFMSLYPLYWLISSSFLGIYQLFCFLTFHLLSSISFSLDYHFARQPVLFLLFSCYRLCFDGLLLFVKRIFGGPNTGFLLKLYKLCIPRNLGMEFLVFRISSACDLLAPGSIVLHQMYRFLCVCVCVCLIPVSAWTPIVSAVWRRGFCSTISFFLERSHQCK